MHESYVEKSDIRLGYILSHKDDDKCLYQQCSGNKLA